MKNSYLLSILHGVLLSLAIASSGVSETLEEAWKIGLETDHLLKAAAENSVASQAELDAAQGGRLPTLNIGAGYSILDNEPISMAGNVQFATADDQSLSYQAMVSLPLYTHFHLSSLIDAATSNLAASKFSELAARQKVKLKIAEAYIAVLLKLKQTEVAISQEQSLAAHAADVQNLHDEGMVPVNDLLAAKVALANAKQIHLQVQNQLDIAKAAYNRLLNRGLGYKVDLQPIPPSFPEIDLETISEDALTSRPELAALREQVDALQLQAEAAKAASGPKVMLASGYSYRENSHQLHEGAWQATVMASWDIFDGNVAKNKGLAIQARSRSVAEQRRDLETLVLLQVRQSWLDMKESRKRIEVTRETLAQAEENLEVTRNRYMEGIGTNTEVLDAESLRTVNYVSYDKANNDALLAVLRLHYAAGSL